MPRLTPITKREQVSGDGLIAFDAIIDSRGSIKPGKLADLVLVDADPTTVDPQALLGIRAVLTLVGGRVVWEGNF